MAEANKGSQTDTTMATSPSAASSSPADSRPASLHTGNSHDLSPEDVAASIPVETLVEHLLAAKRSLSSMTLVLHANDLSTHARQLHEESVILGAQTAFLRTGINEQVILLKRVRKSMSRTYDSGKREFKHLIRTLDSANGKLEKMMEQLRSTIVEAVFRPEGEEPRNLMDFVDEKSVDVMRNALKESIGELQSAQTSYDGDLLRFDNDLRTLSKAMSSAPSSSPSDSAAYQPIPYLLSSLLDHSRAMAEHLTSLTRHFDMCVTAVRITEGGAALARRKAAEVTASQEGGDPVSISGVIAEQESNVADLDPISSQERDEILQVVMQDAPEVDEVVAEINAVLHEMETDFASLKEQADRIKVSYITTTQAFHVLEDIGSRLQSYVAAETEYIDRWEDEKQVIFGKLEEMDGLREFYEGYLSAYESLHLEKERRRSVEEKIFSIFKKAQENVHKLVDADWKEREMFRQEVGEFLPTDLWVGMSGPLQMWDIVPAQPKDDRAAKEDGNEGGRSTPAVKRSFGGTGRQQANRSSRE